ncbi:hypothetical protein J6TS7_20860 [Paenibacillus dendritiformis]|uniref:hypothetical protein n=1 Tax=Paenibacillus dendritiformis TaxID=130049 RepID=UPI001B2F777B|nr:hypothetical protein [Paenibacillus dendritiformis]GIO78476.1 hypothetical protein J6TS7_20860 [Paenibacillus dendritiformis]
MIIAMLRSESVYKRVSKIFSDQDVLKPKNLNELKRLLKNAEKKVVVLDKYMIWYDTAKEAILASDAVCYEYSGNMEELKSKMLLKQDEEEAAAPEGLTDGEGEEPLPGYPEAEEVQELYVTAEEEEAAAPEEPVDGEGEEPLPGYPEAEEVQEVYVTAEEEAAAAPEGLTDGEGEEPLPGYPEAEEVQELYVTAEEEAAAAPEEPVDDEGEEPLPGYPEAEEVQEVYVTAEEEAAAAPEEPVDDEGEEPLPGYPEAEEVQEVYVTAEEEAAAAPEEPVDDEGKEPLPGYPEAEEVQEVYVTAEEEAAAAPEEPLDGEGEEPLPGYPEAEEAQEVYVTAEEEATAASEGPLDGEGEEPLPGYPEAEEAQEVYVTAEEEATAASEGPLDGEGEEPLPGYPEAEEAQEVYVTAEEEASAVPEEPMDDEGEEPFPVPKEPVDDEERAALLPEYLLPEGGEGFQVWGLNDSVEEEVTGHKDVEESLTIGFGESDSYRGNESSDENLLLISSIDQIRNVSALYEVPASTKQGSRSQEKYQLVEQSHDTKENRESKTPNVITEVPAEFRKLMSKKNQEPLTHEVQYSDVPKEENMNVEAPAYQWAPLNEQPNRTTVVAVGGVAPCTGSTHHSLQIANFLARRGYKVACVELSHESPVFYRFAEKRENPFVINGVNFYARMSEEGYFNVIGSGVYHYVVVDMGALLEHNLPAPITKEFVRSQIKILIGQSSIWSFEKMTEAVKVLVERNYLSNVHIILNFASQGMFEEIASTFPRKLMQQLNVTLNQGVYNPDAFILSEEVEKQYESLLGVGVTNEVKPKRLSWFSRG